MSRTVSAAPTRKYVCWMWKRVSHSPGIHQLDRKVEAGSVAAFHVLVSVFTHKKTSVPFCLIACPCVGERVFVSHCFLYAQRLHSITGSLGNSTNYKQHAGCLQKSRGAACSGHGHHILPAALHRVVALHRAQWRRFVTCEMKSDILGWWQRCFKW